MPLTDAFLRSELLGSCIEAGSLAKEIFIARRKDGQKGSGTVDDPYDGSTASAFDGIMTNAIAGATIRLGPGVYPSQGGPTLLPKSGQRIVGSGIHATTIKLTIAVPLRGTSHYVVDQRLDLLDSYEISDLTIDCNLAGQPNTTGPNGSDGYPRIAVGAINLHGSNIVVRRVRVINFGTNTPSYEFDASSVPTWECFAIAVAYAQPGDVPEPHNCIVEECIVEQPALKNARETTCINLSAGEAANLTPAYHEDCVVRNCLVDCDYIKTPNGRPPLLVKSLTADGTTATLETYEDHPYGDDDWVVVSGATDPGGNSREKLGLTARYNGSFKVQAPDSRHLTYNMDAQPASLTAGGEIWLGKAPSLKLAFAAISKIEVQVSQNPPAFCWEVTVTTGSPHFLFPGDHVLIEGIELSGSGVVANRFNGYFQVTMVDPLLELWPSRMFKYRTTGREIGETPIAPAATVGAPFQGVSGDGGYRAVIEGNRILNCQRGGPFHDSFSSRSLIVRGNYYRNVFNGVYEYLGTTDENAFGNGASISGTVDANPGPPPAYRFSRTSGTGIPYVNWQVAKFTSQNPARYVVAQEVDQNAKTFVFDSPGGAPASSSNVERVLGSIGGEITLEGGNRYKFTRKDVTDLMPYEVGDLVVLMAGTVVTHVTVLEIKTGADPVWFKFDAASAPPSPSAAIRLFRIDNLLVENNIFEMAFNMVERHSQSPPCAINITARSPVNGPWVYGSVVVRGNLIRHINGAVDPDSNADSRGIDVSSCRSLIVESNVIGLESADWAIRAYYCGAVKSLNNLNVSGQPMATFRWDLNQHVDDLRSLSEGLFLGHV